MYDELGAIGGNQGKDLVLRCLQSQIEGKAPKGSPPRYCGAGLLAKGCVSCYRS